MANLRPYKYAAENKGIVWDGVSRFQMISVVKEENRGKERKKKTNKLFYFKLADNMPNEEVLEGKEYILNTVFQTENSIQVFFDRYPSYARFSVDADTGDISPLDNTANHLIELTDSETQTLRFLLSAIVEYAEEAEPDEEQTMQNLKKILEKLRKGENVWQTYSTRPNIS